MLIDNIEDLAKATSAQESKIGVVDKAFELCDEIHRSQTSATGNDWSIAGSSGWMGIFTTFNHAIHRLFMKQAKRDREDLVHVIFTQYIIRKTDQKDRYDLILRTQK